MLPYFHHLFLLLSLASLLTVLSDLAADRSALLRLQEAVGGQTIRWNASAEVSPCSWRGVTCSKATTGSRVTELRLPGAGLRGTLPLNSVGSLTELRWLSFRSNALTGELPSDLASCTQLREIHLQGNGFSGAIPESFYSLTNLLRVNFGGNNFSGEISPRFDELVNLTTLYLENNELTGSIPDWNRLVNLRIFNVSFNDGLIGSIPSRLRSFSNQSFLGTSLCGGPLPSCSSSDGNKLSNGAIAGIAVGSFVALLIILCVCFILWRTYNSRKVLPQRSPIPRSPIATATEQYNDISDRRAAVLKNSGGGDGLVFFGKGVQIFSLQQLLSASAEVMGKGTVGSTYKAYFESGIEVIVKRLKNVCVSEAEFRSKIEEIGSLNHQNLEPLKGYFYGREEKLLLYEPIPKGSLFNLLHGYGENNRFLSLEIRAKIAASAASAIEYIHSTGGAAHGNIKSSNIFLTGDYRALVSEFGLAQLVSSSSELNGYRAPEVVDTRRCSQEADVYGLGVVLLELLTCREPDMVLREEGVELPNWVQTVVEEKGTSAAIDPHLLSSENGEEEEGVVELLFVALSCTSRDPHGRPAAAEVARRLRTICGSTFLEIVVS